MVGPVCTAAESVAIVSSPPSTQRALRSVRSRAAATAAAVVPPDPPGAPPAAGGIICEMPAAVVGRGERENNSENGPSSPSDSLVPVAVASVGAAATIGGSPTESSPRCPASVSPSATVAAPCFSGSEEGGDSVRTSTDHFPWAAVGSPWWKRMTRPAPSSRGLNSGSGGDLMGLASAAAADGSIALEWVTEGEGGEAVSTAPMTAAASRPSFIHLLVRDGTGRVLIDLPLLCDETAGAAGAALGRALLPPALPPGVRSLFELPCGVDDRLRVSGTPRAARCSLLAAGGSGADETADQARVRVLTIEWDAGDTIGGEGTSTIPLRDGPPAVPLCASRDTIRGTLSPLSGAHGGGSACGEAATATCSNYDRVLHPLRAWRSASQHAAPSSRTEDAAVDAAVAALARQSLADTDSATSDHTTSGTLAYMSGTRDANTTLSTTGATGTARAPPPLPLPPMQSLFSADTLRVAAVKLVFPTRDSAKRFQAALALALAQQRQRPVGTA